MKRTYTLTYQGQSYSLAPGAFWKLGLPLLLAYGAYFVVFVYYGCHALSYLTGLTPVIAGLLYVVLTARVTLANYRRPGDAEYGLLPQSLTRVLHYAIFGYTIYYLGNVEQWPLWGLAVLCLPTLVSAWQKLKANR